MRQVLAILLATLLVSATGTALTLRGHEVNVADIDQQKIDEAVETYNSQYTKQVPGLVKALVKDEQVNVHINMTHTDDADAVTYGVSMDGMKIDRVKKGGLDEPTLKVYTSTDTVQAIAEAENPRKRAVKALKKGEIRHESVGFFRGLKLGIATALIKVFG